MWLSVLLRWRCVAFPVLRMTSCFREGVLVTEYKMHCCLVLCGLVTCKHLECGVNVKQNAGKPTKTLNV